MELSARLEALRRAEERREAEAVARFEEEKRRELEAQERAIKEAQRIRDEGINESPGVLKGVVVRKLPLLCSFAQILSYTF